MKSRSSNKSPPAAANKLVADELRISEETVKTHMRNIMAKLGASDRTHAVTIGRRRGFLT